MLINGAVLLWNEGVDYSLVYTENIIEFFDLMSICMQVLELIVEGLLICGCRGPLFFMVSVCQVYCRSIFGKNVC